MARIFYHTATGDIYGVHPVAFDDPLPAGVDFIDVPEPPDQIPWPTNANGMSGERYARVQGGTLLARDRATPPESRERRALRALAARIAPAAEAEIKVILDE